MGAACLSVLTECLRRRPWHGAIVRAGPGRGVIEGYRIWEIPGDEEDGLGGFQVGLDRQCSGEADNAGSVYLLDVKLNWMALGWRV